MPEHVYITQSMIKSLTDVLSKDECGLIFQKKFIEGRFDLFKPSDAQKLGSWFEYEATGAIPKDGKIPFPDKTTKGEYTAEYKRMQQHLTNFKTFMSVYNIAILEIGIDIKHGVLKGTVDLLCLAKQDIKDQQGVIRIKKGQKFIIDIKTTGLLDDDRNPFGWDINHLKDKFYLTTQPILYRYITKLNDGEMMPFLFLLFSNKNNDWRAIFFESTEEDNFYIEEKIKNTGAWLKHYSVNGFPAHPTVQRCSNCPIRIGCKHFKMVPDIQYFLMNSSNA